MGESLTKKTNHQPGIITKVLKGIPDGAFENGIVIVLSALIILLPLKMFYILGTNNWKEEYIYAAIQSGIIYAGLFIGVICLAKRIIEEGLPYVIRLLKTHIWLIFFLCFLIWGYLVSCFADDPRLAFYSTLRRNEGYLTFCYYLIVFAIAGMIKSSKKKRILLNIFAVSSTLLCMTIVFQRSDSLMKFFHVQNNIIFTATEKYESIFCHFNHYGYYLCMAILCCAGLIFTDEKKKSMLFHSVLMSINVWALVLNDTFGSYLAATVAMIIMPVLYIVQIRLNHRKMTKKEIGRILLPILIFLIVSGCSTKASDSISSQFGKFTTDVQRVVTTVTEKEAAQQSIADQAGTGRWKLWRTAAGFIADRPVFGYGADGLINLYADAGFMQDRPANEYIEYAAFFGIPGLLFYLAACISILVACMKKLKILKPVTLAVFGCALAYAISACFGNTMYYTTVYFYMFLGLLCTEQAGLETNTNDKR